MTELIEEHTQTILGGKGSGKTTLLIYKGVELSPTERKVLLIDCGGVITKTKLSQFPTEIRDKIRLVSLQKKGLSRIVESKKQLLTLLKLLLGNNEKLTILRLELTASESWVFFQLVSEYLLKLKNLVVMIDEAQEVLPQAGSGNYSQELERLIRVGRNYNTVVYLSSQRPQYLNKKVMALSDIFYFGHMDYYLDSRICSEILGIVATKDRNNLRRSLKSIKLGKFYVVKDGKISLVKYDIKTGKEEVVITKPVTWLGE